jgi:chromosomal replication initiation ATPase DnaA
VSFSPEARTCCIAAGELMNVSAAELVSPLRGSPAVASTRQIAMWLFYEWRRPESWSELGRAFGRDRTTVRHGVNSVSNRMIADEDGLGRKVRGALKQLRRA